MTPLFQYLFEPRRIALIGASADTGKTTSRPQRFLRKHGFTGEILPINPSRPEVLGEKAYPDLDSVPGDIDHAYILLNGQAAVDALAACGRRGVKVASILAGGFADGGEAGATLQQELQRIVRETTITELQGMLKDIINNQLTVIQAMNNLREAKPEETKRACDYTSRSVIAISDALQHLSEDSLRSWKAKYAQR